MLARLGRIGLLGLRELGALGVLFGRVLDRLARLRCDLPELLRAGERFGWQSFPIVAATALLSGGIVVMQSLPAVVQLQAMRLLPWAASFSTLREMAPALIGLMFSGRVGSNNAAELGTMVVTEQIDALRILGIDPYELLVVPRFVAMIVMAASLTIVGDLGAIVGAMLTAKVMAGMDLWQFVMLTRDQVLLSDFLSGVVKGGAFGAEIAIVSSYFGLRTEGGAAGVGRAVNASVVGSALGIIFFDFLLTGALG